MAHISLGFLVWYTLAGVIALVWLGRYFGIRSAIRTRELLTPRSYGAPPDPAPRLSVLVAAKDEEDNIETCIVSLLNQDYPDFEIIAIDDRSRDRTPQILRRLEQKANGKLRVITIRELRAGWFGKNNAMREGVGASTGAWLLFTDADCRQTSSKTLTVAMRDALDHDADFLSITPVLDADTVWERILQPVCTLVLMLWFEPRKVNDPSRKTAYANGAFMLLKRTCYEAIGGHERVRTEVNEDIRMARFAKRLGRKLRVVENEQLYRTRMYDSPVQAWRGWSRIFYGSLSTVRRVVIAMAMLFAYTVLPWTSLVFALVSLASVGPPQRSAWTTAAFAWSGVIILKQFALWRFYGILGVRRIWSFSYLFGAIVAMGILASAMLKVLGVTGTVWRGTSYRGDQIGQGAAADRRAEPADSFRDSSQAWDTP